LSSSPHLLAGNGPVSASVVNYWPSASNALAMEFVREKHFFLF
jgi:hypothetical protein